MKSKKIKMVLVSIKGETETGRKFSHMYFAEELKKKEGDYGNGCYISISKAETDEKFDYIDCSYFKDYQFYNFIFNYFNAYFGDNLNEINIMKINSDIEYELTKTGFKIAEMIMKGE